MCFSYHLIVVSPSQMLRHRPNHAFFLSPVGFYNRVSLAEATDLLTAEVWRSIICLIWFLGKISIFRYFLSSSFLDLEITCVCSVLAWTGAIFPWNLYFINLFYFQFMKRLFPISRVLSNYLFVFYFKFSNYIRRS